MNNVVVSSIGVIRVSFIATFINIGTVSTINGVSATGEAGILKNFTCGHVIIILYPIMIL